MKGVSVMKMHFCAPLLDYIAMGGSMSGGHMHPMLCVTSGQLKYSKLQVRGVR